MSSKPWPEEKLAAIFWSKVAKRGPVQCWPWMGALNIHGYGGTMYRNRHINASRLAWKFANGDPGKLSVLHKCDYRACCNPAHLWLGTTLDNMRDKHQKGRDRGTFQAGHKHPRIGAKLTPERVLEARRLFDEGISQSQIARDWGLASSTINAAVRGTKWRHVHG